MCSKRSWRFVLLAGLAAALLAVPSSLAVHVIDGVDVKVSNDNSNVEGPDPTPSWDAKNRQANETTVAINPLAVNIVAAGANDYRMVPIVGGDAWLGFAVSADFGATWFETYVPGFPNDASPTGLASPLKGLDASGDPGGPLPAGRRPRRRGDRLQPRLRPGRKAPGQSRLRGAVQLHTRNTRRSEHTDVRCQPAELHVRRDRGRRPRRRRVRRAEPVRLRRAVHGQGVDGNRPLPDEPVLGERLRHLDELPGRERQLAHSLQRFDGRWRDLLAGEDDLHRWAGRHAQQPGIGHRRRARRCDLRRLPRVRALDRRGDDQHRQVDGLRQEVVATGDRRAGHLGAGPWRRLPHADLRLRRGRRYEPERRLCRLPAPLRRLRRLRPAFDERRSDVGRRCPGERGPGWAPSDLPDHRRVERRPARGLVRLSQ